MLRALMLTATLAAGLAATGCSTQNASVPPPTASTSPSGSATAAPSGTAPTDVGVTQQSNKLNLASGSGVTSIGYAFSGNYSITADQQSTWGNVTGCAPSSSCTIDVMAGRHDSSQVWNWFTANASGYGCTSSGYCTGGETMNFALTGTLTINGTAYPFTIGQYGDGMANKWWWGGPGWTAGNPATDYTPALTPDGKYTVSAPSNGNNNLTVTAS